MKLQGKAKEDFEKWYSENRPTIEFTINEDGETEEYKIWINQFYEHPNSMKYGVFVDFFRERLKFSEFYIFMGVYLKMINDPTFTPNEARTAAIEKANEIYNERK